MDARVQQYCTQQQVLLLPEADRQYSAMLDSTESLKEKLRWVLDASVATRSQMQNAAGLKTASGVSEWLRTGRVHKRHLPTLARLTGTSLEWWLTPDAPIPPTAEWRSTTAISDQLVTAPTQVARATVGPPATLALDVVQIPQLDVVASMGSGITMPQHEDVVAVLQVHESGLRAQLGNTPVTSFKNLRLITAYGDSMAPTFQGGDVLLVDTGVYEVRLDAIYVMSYRGELFIKRLQRRPDGVLRMLSDNKNYDPIDIHNGQRDEFQALGRVLMAWNARKL